MTGRYSQNVCIEVKMLTLTVQAPVRFVVHAIAASAANVTECKAPSVARSTHNVGEASTPRNAMKTLTVGASPFDD